MSNAFIYNLALAQVASALREAEGYTALAHQGAKGRLRELVVQELLQPLIPRAWGICTGFIVDGVGNSASHQEDLIIYDQQLIPPLWTRGEQAFVPIEACLAVVEVKSLLTAQEVDSAIAHADRIANLAPDFRLLPAYSVPNDERAARLHSAIRRPIYAVFALASNIRAPTNVESLNAEWKRVCDRHSHAGHVTPRIDLLCSVRNGMVCADRAADDLRIHGRQDSDSAGGEVVAFISVLLDLLRTIAPLRHKWFFPPKLLSYLEKPVL